jgi:hypothetical protein
MILQHRAQLPARSKVCLPARSHQGAVRSSTGKLQDYLQSYLLQRRPMNKDSRRQGFRGFVYLKTQAVKYGGLLFCACVQAGGYDEKQRNVALLSETGSVQLG